LDRYEGKGEEGRVAARRERRGVPLTTKRQWRVPEEPRPQKEERVSRGRGKGSNRPYSEKKKLEKKSKMAR